MDSNASNPFYDPGDRQYRRSSNGRSFFDSDKEPEPSPNNPFYTDPERIYKRGGHRNSNPNRRDLLGAENEYSTEPKGLFDDEDDDDFDVDKPFDAEAHRQKLLLMKIRQSANRQVDSQQRSMAMLHDTEQMGIATAEVSFLKKSLN